MNSKTILWNFIENCDLQKHYFIVASMIKHWSKKGAFTLLPIGGNKTLDLYDDILNFPNTLHKESTQILLIL